MKQKDIIVDYEPERIRDNLQWFGANAPRLTREYVVSLFPIATWIHRYNFVWLARDLIAGITVGVVVVPQSMGYAKIANLEPQYGLYTAFIGLMVYCLFATSKDISIGPTAVMSLLLGQTITHIQATSPDITGPQIAITLSLLTGIVTIFIGLIRLGILVDFIPGPVIAGFMTGSAITISVSQWPKLFGITTVYTNAPTYLVFGNFFKALPQTTVDVAFGLGSLVWLYGVRFICDYLTRRYPNRRNLFFYISISRNGLCVIFGTLIAYLISIGKDTPPIHVLKTVPSGFQAMGVPQINGTILSAVAPSLPSAVLILILEHVAIAKSFGRINDYAINPNQEIVAIGFTNIWSSFFGAYPSTGSFSRTAIKARSGVKTPIAGVFSAIVVLLALYAMTPAFYYIPDALLGAVVIHAVTDLVAGVDYMSRLISVSLLEFLVFVVAVIVTFFTSLEYGTYASIGLSILVLLVRLARPKFYTIGRIPLTNDLVAMLASTSGFEKKTAEIQEQLQLQQHLYVPDTDPVLGYLATPLPDGILMVRVDESWTYPNASYIADRVLAYCKKHTRRAQMTISNEDRAWNDDIDPFKDAARAQFPLLHALIFDFGRVSRLDSSGLQAIDDIQYTLKRYSGQPVEFHFVSIPDPLTRTTLLIGGYGDQGTYDNSDTTEQQSPPHVNGHEFSVPSPTHQSSYHHAYHTETLHAAETRQNQYSAASRHTTVSIEHEKPRYSTHSSYYSHDPLNQGGHSPVSTSPRRLSLASTPPVSPAIRMPKDRYRFFHWSADNAVTAAVASLEKKNRNYDPAL